MYLIYKATSPSGRMYVGVTNNFKRRIKEHKTSPWPFGHALRKYGPHNFTYEFEEFDTVEEALKREYELVNENTIKDLYNVSIGGVVTNTLLSQNPMHDKEVLSRHPNLWSSVNNPMNNPESKQKMIQSQKRKRVSVDEVDYDGVRMAAISLGISRQCLVHRLKSNNFPNYFYL